MAEIKILPIWSMPFYFHGSPDKIKENSEYRPTIYDELKCHENYDILIAAMKTKRWFYKMFYQ